MTDASHLGPADQMRVARIDRENDAEKDEATRAAAARIRRMCCPVCARPAQAVDADGWMLCWRCTAPDGDIPVLALFVPSAAPPPLILAFRLDGSRPIVEPRHPRRG